MTSFYSGCTLRSTRLCLHAGYIVLTLTVFYLEILALPEDLPKWKCLHIPAFCLNKQCYLALRASDFLHYANVQYLLEENLESIIDESDGYL